MSYVVSSIVEVSMNKIALWCCATIPNYLCYETEKYMPHILHRQFNSTAVIVLHNFYNHYWAFSIQMESLLWTPTLQSLNRERKMYLLCEEYSKYNLNFYSPPTKLRESYVSTGVCLLFCSEGGGPHCTVLPPPKTWDMGTPLSNCFLLPS